MTKSSEAPDPEPYPTLVEGRDYVLENGLLVFTADYLLRRGTCCRSGCRNCPYGFKRYEEEGLEADDV